MHALVFLAALAAALSDDLSCVFSQTDDTQALLQANVQMKNEAAHARAVDKSAFSILFVQAALHSSLVARLSCLILILIFSMVGVAFPFVAIKYFGYQVMAAGWFVMLQCFAVGLVCGVSLLHVLTDAQESLEKVTDFPVANAVCLFSCFVMVSLNRLTILLVASHKEEHGKPHVHENRKPHIMDVSDRNGSSKSLSGSCAEHSPCEVASSVPAHHGHVHQRLVIDLSIVTDCPASDMTSRYKAYLLELAIAVHSVLVGVGLGIITKNVKAVFTLGVALCFHQLFEGIALGMVGANAGLKGDGVVVMILMFVASCPVGIVLGMCLESSLNKEAATTNWVLGCLNALAAGTLLEIGCVELLPEAFGHKHDNASHTNGNETRVSHGMELARLFWLCAGGGVMVLLALWA